MVVIKGMTMPESCGRCCLMIDVWCYAMDCEDVSDYIEDGERPPWCPLTEIKKEAETGG